MKKIKPLGIIKNKGCAVNHRSLRKILLNPILRIFKLEIVSCFLDNNFEGYSLLVCEWQPNIFKNYYESLFTCNEYDEVIHEHKI